MEPEKTRILTRVPSRKFLGKQPGLSLLEITIVVALMAGLMGVALPRFTTTFESPPQKSAKILAGTIRSLRLNAILSNTRIRLRINPQKRRYDIFQYDVEKNEWKTHKKYAKGIELSPSVFISQILTGEEEAKPVSPKTTEIQIDPIGFVDMVRVYFHNKKIQVVMKVTSIMGDIEIGKETAYEG